jgi:hypothetical protein
MSTDRLSNTGSHAMQTEFMNTMRRIETEEERVLDRAEQLLEERRFEKVMRMTPQAFGRLSPVEKRNFTRWAKHLARVFSEKAAVFERNSTPEPEAPAYLQARL